MSDIRNKDDFKCDCGNLHCDLEEKLRMKADLLGVSMATAAFFLNTLKGTSGPNKFVSLSRRMTREALLSIVGPLQSELVKGGFNRIILVSLRVTTIVCDYARRRKNYITPMIHRAIAQLKCDLEEIRKYAEKMNRRGLGHRLLMASADKAEVKACWQRLSTSWRVFTSELRVDPNFKGGAAIGPIEQGYKIYNAIAQPQTPSSNPPTHQQSSRDSQRQWNKRDQDDYRYARDDPLRLEADILGIDMVATAFFLNTLQSTATLSPIEGLKNACSGLLLMVAALQDNGDGKGYSNHLTIECLRMTVLAIRRRNNEPTRAHAICRAIRQLEGDLEGIRGRAETMKSRRRLGAEDRARVNAWWQRLFISWCIFTTELMMEVNHKVTKAGQAREGSMDVSEVEKWMTEELTAKEGNQINDVAVGSPVPPFDPPAQQQNDKDPQLQWNKRDQDDYQYARDDPLRMKADALGVSMRAAAFVLCTLKSTATLSPIEGLKNVCSGLLLMVAALQDKSEVRGSLDRIIASCLRVTCIVCRHAKRQENRVTPVIRRAIDQLQHDFEEIKEYAERMSKRRQSPRLFMTVHTLDETEIRTWWPRLITSWGYLTAELMMDGLNYEVPKVDSVPVPAGLTKPIVEDRLAEQRSKTHHATTESSSSGFSTEGRCPTEHYYPPDLEGLQAHKPPLPENPLYLDVDFPYDSDGQRGGGDEQVCVLDSKQGKDEYLGNQAEGYDDPPSGNGTHTDFEPGTGSLFRCLANEGLWNDSEIFLFRNTNFPANGRAFSITSRDHSIVGGTSQESLIPYSYYL